VEAVLRLVPDDGTLAVEDLGGDLLAGMRRQAVQDDGAVLGRREQVGVEAERSEVGAAALRLRLVPHADPDIGVERIGTGDGGARIVGQLGTMAVGELVAGRSAYHNLHPGKLPGDRQGAGDVVAVADVGEAQAGEIAEALAQGEQVGQRLAGVMEGSEPVNDRHLGRGRQLGDSFVGGGANHDRVDVARQHPRRVADRLAAGDLEFIAAQDERRRAQLGDAYLEGDPRPGRGLLEDEGDAAPGEDVAANPVSPPRFQLQRAVEQLPQLKRPQLFACEEIALQAADTKPVQFTAITWNLFHGRDFPPDPALFTWRSRLLRMSEGNATHVQVNRDLEAEFAATLAGAAWDVALLQESPPRFAAALARACGAEAHLALTSRNRLGPLRAAAARLNPDLIASGEGGSNLTLVRSRGPLGAIVERSELAIHEGRPERRAIALTRTASDLCVANLHATNDFREMAVEDVLLAARAASTWAGERPLLFGGDLNLRPAKEPGVFDQLRERFGLAAPTAAGALDHLLARGLKVVELPTPWPAQRRELCEGGLALRLSDHSPVEARFATASNRN
jgi:endonuclease/exonuclease/phosphatase family metal-dependent hydrolase